MEKKTWLSCLKAKSTASLISLREFTWSTNNIVRDLLESTNTSHWSTPATSPWSPPSTHCLCWVWQHMGSHTAFAPWYNTKCLMILWQNRKKYLTCQKTPQLPACLPLSGLTWPLATPPPEVFNVIFIFITTVNIIISMPDYLGLWSRLQKSGLKTARSAQ